MESPSVDDDGDCFSPLILNATSVNVEVYYNKAVNYTLMVTFVSFIFYFYISLAGQFQMSMLYATVGKEFLNIYPQVSFLQVLLLIRQMEHSNTQSVRNLSKNTFRKPSNFSNTSIVIRFLFPFYLTEVIVVAFFRGLPKFRF